MEEDAEEEFACNDEDMEQEEIIEDDDNEGDDELNAIDHLYLLDAADTSESDEDPNYKELKSANGVPYHNAAEMVTGVKIDQFMRCGDILTTRTSDQRRNQRMKNMESGVKAQMNVVSRAVCILRDEQVSTFGIIDGKDQNVEEFKDARGYDIPEEFRNLKRGWARRRDRGQMYGRKYIRRFKKILYEWFKVGSVDSEMKMGPSMMLEKLRDLFPGIYTLPSFTEIQSFISQLFTKQKKNENTTPADDFDDEDESVDEDENDLVQAAIEVVDSYAGSIKPSWVQVYLVMRHGESGVTEHLPAVKKAIGKSRNKWKNQSKKMLIG